MGADDSLRKLKRKINAKKNSEKSSKVVNFMLDEGEETVGATQSKPESHTASPKALNETERRSSKAAVVGKSKKSGKSKKKNQLLASKVAHDNLLENRGEDAEDEVYKMSSGDEDNSKGTKKEMVATTQSIPEDHLASPEGLNETGRRRRRSSKAGKSKKSEKTKKKSRLLANEVSHDNLLEKKGQDAEDEVYQMSSGDEDYSKGMKKWISQYHQSRPGLKVLQEKIDDFIMAHEAQEEQAKVEREAEAAEGGWTVVVQHKGRKKTTDAESGVTVGSVAQTAVLDKMGKKKKKEVGIDFYRFQKREAHRNEIMMLQSKFEQDKKRIQQMRAARKFRPY